MSEVERLARLMHEAYCDWYSIVKPDVSFHPFDLPWGDLESLAKAKLVAVAQAIFAAGYTPPKREQ